MKANIEALSLKGEIEIDLNEANHFLNLIIPEFCKDGVGILNDLVKSWRLKNQIKIIKQAKVILKQNNIEASTVPLKILFPLLEKSSLEEDEALQNKWAKLLAYASYSKEFEYTKSFINILDQLTVLEANILDWMDEKIEKKPNYIFSIKETATANNTKEDKLIIIFGNFSRLGLIMQETKGQGINFSLTINIQPNREYKITSFGKKFLHICNNKI